MRFDDQIWSGFLSFFSILKIVQAIWSLHMLLAFILLCFKPCCKWLQKMEFVPLPPQSFSRDVENFGDTCVFMTSCKRKLCETCLVFASTSNFFGCKSANMGKFWWKNMGHWSVDICGCAYQENMGMRWRGLGTEVVQGSNLSPASLRMWIFEIVVGDLITAQSNWRSLSNGWQGGAGGSIKWWGLHQGEKKLEVLKQWQAGNNMTL